MRKLLAAVIATLLFCPVIIAQKKVPKGNSHFGFKAGVNVSRFRTAVHYTNFESKLKTGMVLGGFVEIPISSRLMIQPEFLYSQMGSRGSSTQDGAIVARYNYFSIPLELKYKCHNFMLIAGPQMDFLIRARQKNFFGTKTITNDVQDFDCGFTVGAEYWFSKHWVIAARYLHGIRDSALPDETNTFFNQGVQLNIGYKLFQKVKKPKKEKKK